MNQRGGTRANKPIKLTIRSVTPLACASGAPARPAAYRQRSADKNRPEIRAVINSACGLRTGWADSENRNDRHVGWHPRVASFTAAIRHGSLDKTQGRCEGPAA